MGVQHPSSASLGILYIQSAHGSQNGLSETQSEWVISK